MIEVYFSLEDNSETLKLPYVQKNFSIPSPLKTTTFTNVEGEDLTLIGSLGNRELEINSFFPHKLYRFLESDAKLADECIDFFNRNRKKKFRFVVVTHSRNYCNFLVTITNFTYNEKINLDVDYSISIKEYKSPIGG